MIICISDWAVWNDDDDDDADAHDAHDEAAGCGGNTGTFALLPGGFACRNDSKVHSQDRGKDINPDATRLSLQLLSWWCCDRSVRDKKGRWLPTAPGKAGLSFGNISL